MARCISLSVTRGNEGPVVELDDHIEVVPPNDYRMEHHQSYPFPRVCVGSGRGGRFFVISQRLQERLEQREPRTRWQLTHANLVPSRNKPFPFFDCESRIDEGHDNNIILLAHGFEDLTTAMMQVKHCFRRGTRRLILFADGNPRCEVCGEEFDGQLHPDLGQYEDWPTIRTHPAVDRAGLEVIHEGIFDDLERQALIRMRPGAVLRCTMIDHLAVFLVNTGWQAILVDQDEALRWVAATEVKSGILTNLSRLREAWNPHKNYGIRDIDSLLASHANRARSKGGKIR